MAIDLYELARRYVAKIPPAISGSGGHNATFQVACALVKGFDLTVNEARPLLDEYNGRCDPAWTDAELRHKLTQADKVPDSEPRGYLRLSNAEKSASGYAAVVESARAAKPLAPPPKPSFRAEELARFASRWREFVDTAWLSDRSPEPTYARTPAEFLTAVFREGEKVVCFVNQQSQGQALWPLEEPPAAGAEGVWYLAQPVDGAEHPNPRSLDAAGQPKPSRRSEESVTAWRHLVLESDEADARDWMAAVVQLPLPIVAIYTSGGRSIHALVRVDAPTKQEWDNCVRQIKPILVTLGADPKAMSAVRLSRLPGCMRAQKLQKLLYLNPEPTDKPIITLPRERDVLGHWRAMVEMLEATPAAAREQGCGAMIDDCRAALEWYANAAPARAMLAKLNAWDEESAQ